MKAMYYDSFGKTPEIRSVPDPKPGKDGVVIKVEATGICRSDWHGWMGHDPDINLPHVPGHELAGVITAVNEALPDTPGAVNDDAMSAWFFRIKPAAGESIDGFMDEAAYQALIG